MWTVGSNSIWRSLSTRTIARRRRFLSEKLEGLIRCSNAAPVRGIGSIAGATRLCGFTEWFEFEGRTTTQKILGGFGNVEDNALAFPDGEVRAAAFRSFNPETQS